MGTTAEPGFTSHSAYRSIHIVALGSECPGGVGQGEEMLGQGQLQGGLLWSYLGHGALVGHCDPEDSLHNPAFMEYTSRVFGDVTVVVRDCPSWVRDTPIGKVRVGIRWRRSWTTECHHSHNTLNPPPPKKRASFWMLF